jgi:hypothetical protein
MVWLIRTSTTDVQNGIQIASLAAHGSPVVLTLDRFAVDSVA